MIKVLSIFGTRPDAIKMVPVIRALAARKDRVESRICVTAQHRGMLDQVLAEFSLRPDYDLDLMTSWQSPTEVATRALVETAAVISRERPDWVVVQGDTTTAVAAALAARYAQVRVAHVEAGLRSHDRCRPFPEEINRLLVTAVADLHFAPTPKARENLLREGIPGSRIVVTGNSGIDTLLATVAGLRGRRNGHPWSRLPAETVVILATAHRRESLGPPLRQICAALGEIAETHRGTVQIVFPVHPRPEVRETAYAILGQMPNVTLSPPMAYHSLVELLLRCDLVITDSGGLQEEAPSLGKPVLVLRDVTERTEAMEAGTALLVGTDRATIVRQAGLLLRDPSMRRSMSRSTRLYGDGGAAERIVGALLGEVVSEWKPETLVDTAKE